LCKIVPSCTTGGFRNAFTMKEKVCYPLHLHKESVLRPKVLLLTDIHPDPLSGSPTSQDSQRTIDFYFKVPNEPDTSLPEQHPIPPIVSPSLPASLSIPLSKTSNSRHRDDTATVFVKYHISAYIFRRETVIASTSRYIQIFPSVPASPPLYAAVSPKKFTYSVQNH